MKASFKYIYMNIACLACIFLEYVQAGTMTYLLQAKARIYEH